MKTSAVFFYFSSLVSASLAFPPSINPVARSPVGAEWSVYDYILGCPLGGCTFRFNIAWDSSPPNEPDFATTCTGTNVADELHPCQDTAISSMDVTGTENFTVVAQHMYTVADGTEYFVTGNTIVSVISGDYAKAFGISRVRLGLLREEAA